MNRRNFVKERLKDRLDARIARHVRATYEMIDVEPKQGLFNYQCFDNASEWARKHPGHEVVEVMYIERGSPRLHYVNFNPKSGKYLETTLGYKAPRLEYYRLRAIHPSDHLCIIDERV